MLEGIDTGRLDSNGNSIKCGDRIEYTQFKAGYVQRHTEDGWGRTVHLCRHDQVRIPDREKTIKGFVVYSQELCGFIVKLDENMIDSGRTEDQLHRLLNFGRGEKLVVI